MSQTAVTRIWRAFGLQPHWQETIKLSSDPLFFEKVRDIVGLYLDLPLKTMVSCVDEKSQAVLPRAMVIQHKTHRPVQFEITEQTRQSVAAWIEKAHLVSGQYISRAGLAKSPHLSTPQYARIVARWVESIGLDASAYSTQTMRRTKATLICRRTKNLRAVRLLLNTRNWKARFVTLALRSTVGEASSSLPRADAETISKILLQSVQNF
jgi:hypothetical protein